MMQRSSRGWLTVTLFAVFSASACGRERPAQSPASQGAPQTEPARHAHRAERTVQSLSDAKIADRVKASLNRDPGVHSAGIDVSSTDGVIELTGTVSDLLTKRRAVRVAENVKGVRAVSDRIELELGRLPDQELKRKVDSALLYNATTDAYEIQTRVENGVVRLTGHVQSFQEHDLAARVVEGVRGVRDVQNQLRIEYGALRSDREVKADVESRLRWDSLINDGLIKVAVEDGRVTLSGAVASAAERRRAFADAWVKGVRAVDNSGLEVTWWAREQDLTRSKLKQVDSSQIERAVREAIAYDPRVSAAKLTVKVVSGRASLQGQVGSPNARMAAEDLARHTVGVLSVDNELEVVPERQVSDAVIEERVQSELLWDPYTEAYRIGVRVEGGTVTLSGTVDTAFERAEATALAGSVDGVRKVQNNLDISRREVSYVYSPYHYPYAPYWESWHYAPPKPVMSDRLLRRNIREQLAWSPFVDADQIEVQVAAGTATLTGQVDTWQERSAATDSAFAGGALIVENDLKIASGD